MAGLLRRDELVRIAQETSKKALESVPIPDDVRNGLVITEALTANGREFRVIFPGERPDDALVLLAIQVDRNTGVAATQVYWPMRPSRELSD